MNRRDDSILGPDQTLVMDLFDSHSWDTLFLRGESSGKSVLVAVRRGRYRKDEYQACGGGRRVLRKPLGLGR